MAEFTMNAKKGSIEMRIIDETINVEFCKVREECLGIFCQYGYAGILGRAELLKGFTIWDMAAKELRQAIYFPKGHVGHEPQVIPKTYDGHNQLISDDVYIGTIVQDTIENESYFFLYDGHHDSGFPLIAKLRFPVRVPYGFHSQWVPGKDLRAHIAFHKGTNKTRNYGTSKNRKNLNIRITNELRRLSHGI